MAIDPSKLSLEQLRNLVANYRARGMTTEQIYAQALAELDRKESKGLNFEMSKNVILQAARDGRFVSYKELADASGVPWGQAHYAIGPHLYQLVEYAHLQGWPLLSAIVVNKQNVATGEMDESNLKGFLSAARALKIPVADERQFLRTEQQRVFAWGKAHKEGTGPQS